MSGKRLTGKPNGTVNPTRISRVRLSSYQGLEAVRQLRVLAAEEETTIQALTAEALNLLFMKYGKLPVATP